MGLGEATDIPIHSEKLGEILEQKPTGPTGNGMKGHAALIEPSKFDRSQSKFSYQRGNHFTCFGIIARYEYGLSLPRRVPICPELCCRQVVEGFDEARANESLTDDLGREATSQSLWRNTERIRDINENLAVPLLKLLRDLLVRSEWYCEEDNLSPMSFFNRNRAHGGTRFLRQRLECLRSTRVGNSDFDVLAGEDACKRGSDLA